MIGFSGCVVLASGMALPLVSTACGGLASSATGAWALVLAAVFEVLDAAVFALAAAFEFAVVFDCWVNAVVGDDVLHANINAR
jgi:hypothetical protein